MAGNKRKRGVKAKSASGAPHHRKASKSDSGRNARRTKAWQKSNQNKVTKKPTPGVPRKTQKRREALLRRAEKLEQQAMAIMAKAQHNAARYKVMTQGKEITGGEGGGTKEWEGADKVERILGLATAWGVGDAEAAGADGSDDGSVAESHDLASESDASGPIATADDEVMEDAADQQAEEAAQPEDDAQPEDEAQSEDETEVKGKKTKKKTKKSKKAEGETEDADLQPKKAKKSKKVEGETEDADLQPKKAKKSKKVEDEVGDADEKPEKTKKSKKAKEEADDADEEPEKVKKSKKDKKEKKERKDKKEKKDKKSKKDKKDKTKSDPEDPAPTEAVEDSAYARTTMDETEDALDPLPDPQEGDGVERGKLLEAEAELASSSSPPYPSSIDEAVDGEGAATTGADQPLYQLDLGNAHTQEEEPGEAKPKAKKSDKKKRKHKETAPPEDAEGVDGDAPAAKPKKKKKSRKSKGGDEVAPAEDEVESADAWNVGELSGGADRQQKFYKLLGGKKTGVAKAATTAVHAQGHLDADKIGSDMERLMEAGQMMKLSGRKMGLGSAQ